MQESANAKDLKVLIISENASSEFGGEAILPLNYFLLLTEKNIDCYLLTHERVKSQLELIKNIKHDHIFYISDTKLATFLYKLGAVLPDRVSLVTIGFIHNLIEQFQMWILARKVVKNIKITLVHQPMPVSPKYPSMVFGLSAPVVIGPMNGGMDFPEAFSQMASRTEQYLYFFLRPLSSIINVILPGKMFAKLLLVANQRTAEALPILRFGKVRELVENGVFLNAIPEKLDRHIRRTSEINIIYVGRMVDWKAIDILIDAFHQSKLSNLKLMLVGDGSERPKLEQKVKDLNVKNVTFYGRVPFLEVNQYYEDADIFVLPSVRECGGAVVLEAMARGLPVIATSWGGPADYLTPETGILVEPKSRDYMVAEFAKQIDLLAQDETLRVRLGEAAKLRVKTHFLWENKIDKMIALYQSVI